MTIITKTRCTSQDGRNSRSPRRHLHSINVRGAIIPVSLGSRALPGLSLGHRTLTHYLLTNKGHGRWWRDIRHCSLQSRADDNPENNDPGNERVAPIAAKCTSLPLRRQSPSSALVSLASKPPEQSSLTPLPPHTTLSFLRREIG